LITTLPEAAEIHPEALDRVNVYVPDGMPYIVMLVPVADVVVPPGFLVKVQVPEEGNPFISTLPVAISHSGWVIVPMAGGAGVAGWALMTTLPVEGEVHPEALVTLKVYELAERPDIVTIVPVPVTVVPSGVLVKVHVPVDGKLLKTTLPVATVQAGCVIVPIVGAVGVIGCVLIITLFRGSEVHPDALVTVKVYILAASPVIVILVPVPVVVPPGVLDKVHVPVAGNPFNTMLPVERVHVG